MAPSSRQQVGAQVECAPEAEASGAFAGCNLQAHATRKLLECSSGERAPVARPLARAVRLTPVRLPVRPHWAGGTSCAAVRGAPRPSPPGPADDDFDVPLGARGRTSAGASEQSGCARRSRVKSDGAARAPELLLASNSAQVVAKTPTLLVRLTPLTGSRPSLDYQPHKRANGSVLRPPVPLASTRGAARPGMRNVRSAGAPTGPGRGSCESCSARVIRQRDKTIA